MKNNSILAEVLDKAVDRMFAGENVFDILKDYPEYAEELSPLLETAEQLKNAPAPDEGDCLASLMTVVAKISAGNNEMNRQTTVLPFSRKRVLLRIAASFAFVFFIGWGTVYASADTVPGDFLYPLKLITEKVRFMLSVNKENRLELRIAYSNERLKELVRKYNSGGGLDKALLSRMLDEAKAALDDSQNIDNHIQPIINERLSNLSHLQIKTLERLKKNASPGEQKIINTSINRCGRMMQCCMKNISEKSMKNMKEGSSGRCPMMDNRKKNCDEK